MTSTIALPGSGRVTTRIGIGTSGLHGGWGRRESLRILDAAYEHGLRHVDTAPLYGLGYAESVVGEFLARHRDDVTVTTKYGLFPPKRRLLWEIGRAVARPVARRVPWLRKRLLSAVSAATAASAPAAPAPAAGPPRSTYSAAAMRASLEHSLRELRRDRIDVFLLHEATERDLDDELRRALEDSVAAGTIGTWGFGSARPKIEAIVAAGINPPVLQFDFPPDLGAAFAITHSVLSAGLRRLPVNDREFRAMLANASGIDVEAPGAIPQLLIAAALAANQNGIVLFTSKRVEHIASIASVLSAPGLLRAGAAALDVLQPR